ncbi:Chagasin family peptidase inhibitor I42 [uncultured archaeon]|nr:Chagasin family peptidase inhibitor I42 [uncultured archaeon]
MKVNPDPNYPIEVTLGHGFTISLESIPTAGYTWNVEYDSKMIDLLKPKKYVPYSSAVGGGGWEIFEFQAKQPGETLIRAKYKRSWETNLLETHLFKIHITAENKL